MCAIRESQLSSSSNKYISIKKLQTFVRSSFVSRDLEFIERQQVTMNKDPVSEQSIYWLKDLIIARFIR